MNHQNHVDGLYADCAECYPNEPLSSTELAGQLGDNQVAGDTRIYTYADLDDTNPDDFDRPDTDI